MTEWFVYVERKHDGRRAIVAGPYPDRPTAEGRVRLVVEVAEVSAREGARLWFETWGVCEAPVGTLTPALGYV